jgi:hypothetical protein
MHRAQGDNLTTRINKPAPGHCGVEGNEEADEETTSGSVQKVCSACTIQTQQRADDCAERTLLMGKSDDEGELKRSGPG